jgi:hypothetical protein
MTPFLILLLQGFFLVRSLLKEWCPPVVQPAAQDRLVILGCRVCQTVAVVARAVIALVLLAVTVPWAGTVGAVSLPLVRSCGCDGAASVQEPGVEKPSAEVLCVEEPSDFRRGHAKSSGELKPKLHW